MKLKKSLMAITTATAVAISGTAVASAQDTTGGSLENITGGGVTGSLGGDDETTDPADDTEDSATGSADFFGWDEDTKPFEKLTSIAAVFTTVVGIIGGIATLVGTIMKINDMLAPKN